MAMHVRPAPGGRLGPLAAGLAALALLAGALPLRATADDAGRVIAIGDIHGHLDGFRAILRATGLIDTHDRWTGGRATLVQTGDFSDRGAGVREVMDLLMRLEREAPRHGGRVVTLVGNHELMVLIGDLREVTPEICAAFADERSEARRERAWREHAALVRRQAGAFETPPPVYALTRDDFLTKWPLGCLEYREALAPRHPYGAWLRSLPAAAIVEGTLYMHAGARPDLPVSSIDEINLRVRDEILKYDTLTAALVQARLALPHYTLEQMVGVAMAQVAVANARITEARARGHTLAPAALDVPAALAAADLTTIGEWWLVAPDGPMWYRGYAMDDDGALDAPLGALLARLGATHMAVAHTVTNDARIRTRSKGRLFLIDTGMLTPVYNGQPSALEREAGGRFSAVYLDRRETLAAGPEP